MNGCGGSEASERAQTSGPCGPGQRWEIIIGGEGGQGVVLAGALLGEAAVRAGLNAAHTSSYGIATRGGFTRSDVIVVPANEEIAYPRVRRPGLVVALSEGAYGRLLPFCGPATLLIRDTAIPCPVAAGGGAAAPSGERLWRELVVALRDAARQAGGERVINMVALGAALAATAMFSPAFLEEVLRDRFRGERGETNCRAMWAGYGLVPHGRDGKGD
ncbi:MAG: 2-oxoacid:acceptor oxidoreductase family protein [Bacillota bacterium]